MTEIISHFAFELKKTEKLATVLTPSTLLTMFAIMSNHNSVLPLITVFITDWCC